MWQASHRQSEIRVTHQGTPLVVGLALDRVAYHEGPYFYAMGAGLVLGAHHVLLSRLYAELDATLGLQRPYRYQTIFTDGPSKSGVFVSVEAGSLELYTRLSAGLALHVASWLDIPVRLTLHSHPVGETRSLAAVSVGLRCLLP
jgi:hypothetical protein